MTKNGTTKIVSIIVITAIALGGLVWGLSGRSGNLERVVQDVTVLQAACAETVKSVTDLEKAVIRIQSDMGHMKTDIATILTLQRRALGIPE